MNIYKKFIYRFSMLFTIGILFGYFNGDTEIYVKSNLIIALPLALCELLFNIYNAKKIEKIEGTK